MCLLCDLSKHLAKAVAAGGNMQPPQTESVLGATVSHTASSIRIAPGTRGVWREVHMYVGLPFYNLPVPLSLYRIVPD